MPSQAQERDYRLDVMKLVGLLGIIVAHTAPPNLWLQIRVFDVSTMVFVSGCLLAHTSAYRTRSYLDYAVHRTLRLIGPTWCFLVFYFGTVWLLSRFSPGDYGMDRQTMIETFGLLSGIGYVWIIRVLLLIALVAPLMLHLRRAMGSAGFALLLIAIAAAYELLVSVQVGPHASPHAPHDVWDYAVYPMMAYGYVFGIGLWLPSAGRGGLIGTILISAALFVGMWIWADGHGVGPCGATTSGPDGFPQLNDIKYPPRLHVLAYGVLVSSLMYAALRPFRGGPPWLKKTLAFISGSSMWIYLWHIFYLGVFNWFSGTLPQSMVFWPGLFFAVTILSVATTAVQKRLVGAWLARMPDSSNPRHIIQRLILP